MYIKLTVLTADAIVLNTVTCAIALSAKCFFARDPAPREEPPYRAECDLGAVIGQKCLQSFLCQHGAPPYSIVRLSPDSEHVVTVQAAALRQPYTNALDIYGLNPNLISIRPSTARHGSPYGLP